MRRVILLSVLLGLVAAATAALVPRNFSDSPPVQKLTRAFTRQNWNTAGFNQCHGVAMRRILRKSTLDSTYYLWAVSDEDWDGVVYGVEMKVAGQCSVVTASRYGTEGAGSAQLFTPLGLTIDTVVYDGQSDNLYLYVAERGNNRVSRLRFDWASKTLSSSGLVDPGLSAPTDVCCIARRDRPALLFILDSGHDRLLVLEIEPDFSYELLAAYGSSGAGVGQFVRPTDLCVCPRTSGGYSIYVSDPCNSRVVALHMSDQGNVSWEASYSDGQAGFAGIAADGIGYVYVAAQRVNAIYALSPDLTELHYIYTGSELAGPRGIAFNGDELAVTEEWTDSSGIQYFRIVPGFERLECDSFFDATLDSCQVTVEVEELNAYVDIDIWDGQSAVRRLASDTLLTMNVAYDFVWDGRDDSGRIALPDRYTVRASGAFSRGESDPALRSVRTTTTTVKGTQIPGVISSNTTWDTLHEPYVLSGHSLDISDNATLMIEPGVRVMFAEDSPKRGIVVHIYCRIEANGTAQDSIYFMPYRKMAEAYNPAKRGLWGEIDFNYHNYGAIFNHCVFENGGGAGWDSAVVYASAPDEGSTLDFDNCHFLGSGSSAVGVNSDGARERVDFDTCRFEYCADYPIFKVKAQNVADLCATCTFANNDVPGLMVNAAVGNDERIQSSCTWPCMSPGWHCDLDGDLQVWSNTGGYPVLAIGAGTSIRMPANGEIQIGNGNDQGAIVAAGSPGAPVVFEGLNGATWDGVWLDYDPNNQSSFRYCIFKDGTGQSRMSLDGMDYFPMLYCQTSPPVYRCKFLDAFQSAGDDVGAGFGTEGVPSHVSQCKFMRNEVGIVADYSSVYCCTTYNCMIDSGGIGFLVLDLSDNSQPYLRNTNVFANNSYGVANLDTMATVNANGNWWGVNNGGGPGNGNNGTYGNVTATSWSSSPYTLWSMDAQAVSILTPVGWHVPGAVEPRAVVRNYLDTTVTFTARLGIGTVYLQSVEETLTANAVDTVVFPQATLDSGWYNLGLAVDLAGDENPSNDSVADTVWVRDSVDAAAIAVIAPPAQITVDDTIEPRVSIANYGTIARQIPVKFYLDTVYQATESALVAAHETAEVSFDARTFSPDTHQVMFVASLPLDDDRTNDTARATVYVKPGDYWVAQDSPPYATARLCWDKGQYLYAAERAGSGVRRFNTLANDWSAVSGPAVETVFGITSLKGQVYVLGKASGVGADEARSQKLDARAQNVPQTTDKSKGISQKPEVKTRDAAEAKHGAAFSNELGIYRYVAAGDSWVLVTTCDTSIKPHHNGANLVADDAGSIYLIEGGTPRVLRYIVAADSWVLDTASFVISRWGAAAWSRGKLYVLADPLRVLALDPATGQWSTISLTSPDSSYGTALCADPVMDRLLAFCHRPPGVGTQVPPFRERALRADVVVWSVRAGGVEDTTGAALCFGSTQAYCLDGYGGFWRYRPTPQFDAAAVATAIPDTIPLDSAIVPAGIVQNTWKAALPCSVHITIGSYASSRTDTVPPQQWDTVTFDSTSFSPGTYPITLIVSLGGEAYHYNDTATGSLFVRYRTDAQALAVESPVGRIPYDSLIHPEGRIGSNSDETLDVWAKMTLGSSYTDSVLVTLPPLGESTVTFDTCHLRVGVNTALLRVRCDGDEVPGNDEVADSVEIIAGDYWKVLAQCPDNEVRLVGRPGSAIYSVKRSGTNFRYYDPAQDTWVSKANSPLSTNLSLYRQGNKVYALGSLALGLDEVSFPGLGREPESPAGFGNSPRNDRAQTGVAPVNGLRNGGGGRTDAGPAVVRYHITSNSWFTVSTQLPFSIGDGSCLFMTCDSTLFVLGSGSVLWRYCINHQVWDQRTPMPESVCAWTSGAYDNAGHFYVLADSNGKLREYNVAGNSWDSLTPLAGSTPTGSALCCDSARNRLYALWADTSPGAYCYDIAGDEWTEVESFPSSLTLPALTQCGDNPYGQNGSTFARYVPEPELDVAALAILVPGDTERYDSAVVPTGVVHNLSEVPVWCEVTITLGDTVRVVPSLYLESGETDTVAFDSTYLPAGRITATLHVTCTGDENPDNDTCSKPVQVDAPWEPRNQTNYAQGRLDADTGVAVYFAPGSSAGLQKYSVSGDTWSGMLAPPFAANCLDLAYYNGALYALGLVGTDGASKGRKLISDAGPSLTSHPAIYRYTLGDTIWTLVSDSLPLMMVAAGRWIVATGPGIYLEPGYGRAFYRYATGNGWTTRDSLPVSVTSPVALDWDRDDEIFLLGAVSAESSAFLGYSISGDSWVTLTTIPVQPQAGVAIAAEPDGNTVLALMPADSSPALLYGYDRTQDTWTLLTSPTWTACTGAAMTWAGTEAYALTGHMPTGPGGSSSFWCYDPGFAAYWGRGLEGVAGKALPLLRWQLTCAPNPLSARAVIRWQVPRLSSVSLKVYNTAGQMVRVLSQGSAKPGSYTATWNGCDQKGRRLAAGVYVCALDGPGARITRKVVLTE